MVEDLIKLREKLEHAKPIFVDTGKKYGVLSIPTVLGTAYDETILQLDFSNSLKWYYNRVEDANVIEECEEEFKNLVNILANEDRNYDLIHLETDGFSVLCEEEFVEEIVDMQKKLSLNFSESKADELSKYIKSKIGNYVYSDIVLLNFKYFTAYKAKNYRLDCVIDGDVDRILGYVKYDEFAEELKKLGYSLSVGGTDKCDDFDEYLLSTITRPDDFGYLSIEADLRKNNYQKVY